MPLWMVFLTVTQDIIAVNESAIDHYGYTQDEFLKLNATDLQLAFDTAKDDNGRNPSSMNFSASFVIKKEWVSYHGRYYVS